MTDTFDLGAMLSTPQAIQNSIKQIPCEMLKPCRNHKFEMYTGERLEDMVASIKENGVLSPIVVQPTVPAIVKEGLTEDEAEMYVIESNLMQRGFSNLRISEQAEVVAMRYDKMFSQGKRNDIVRELQLIENPDLADEDNASKTSREKAGDEYGLSRNSAARLVRVSKLIDSLKEYVDSGDIAVRTAVNLSCLSETAQLEISELLDDYKVDMKKSEQLRGQADENGNIPSDTIIQIIAGIADDMPKPKSVRISNDTFSRYFEKGTKQKEITETVEKALAYYFASIRKEQTE